MTSWKISGFSAPVTTLCPMALVESAGQGVVDEHDGRGDLSEDIEDRRGAPEIAHLKWLTTWAPVTICE